MGAPFKSGEARSVIDDDDPSPGPPRPVTACGVPGFPVESNGYQKVLQDWNRVSATVGFNRQQVFKTLVVYIL